MLTQKYDVYCGIDVGKATHWLCQPDLGPR